MMIFWHYMHAWHYLAVLMSEDQLAGTLICLTCVLDMVELVRIMGGGDTISL